MDTFQQSTSVYALAVTLAKSMSTEELTRASLLLTQLSTTMATLAGLQNLEQSSSTQELADQPRAEQRYVLAVSPESAWGHAPALTVSQLKRLPEFPSAWKN